MTRAGNILLVLLLCGAPADAGTNAEALQQILRGSDSTAVKLSAIEVYKATEGSASLKFLEKKDFGRLQESLQSEVEALVAAGDGPRALALWIRYLRTLPADKDAERFRRFLPALAAPVRQQLGHAEELFAREDYLGAWRLASELIEAGAGLEGAPALRAKASAAGELASRFDALLPRVELDGDGQAVAEIGRLGEELGRLHSAPTRRGRAATAFQAALALHRAGDSDALRAKLDELAALEVPTAGLRREMEAESQQALVGGISRGIEPVPAEPTVRPTPRPPTPVPTRPPATSPTRAAPVARATAPADANPTPPAGPAATATPQAGQPAAAVARRVHEAARRETEFYRKELRAAGASGVVPHFQLEAVELRGWTAEVHLLAALDDPERQVVALFLPRADRQFFRLVATRILEEAPELGSVELHLALQNGRTAPVDIGSVRMDPELLKLTAALPIEAFWKRLDSSRLEPAWSRGGPRP